MIAAEQGISQSLAASMQEQKQLTDTGSRLLQTGTGTDNYLAAAEGHSEENYNMIDGRMDVQSKLTPGDDTEIHLERHSKKRSSVLAKLKEKQASLPESRKPDTEIIKSKDGVSLD